MDMSLMGEEIARLLMVIVQLQEDITCVGEFKKIDVD